MNLGAAYSARNESERAIDAFKRALQFEPKNERAHFSLGLMYLQVGQKDLAMAEYQALQALGSKFSSSLLAE